MKIICSICQEPVLSTHICLILRCGHLYHENCLTRWTSVKKTCPHCRNDVSEQPFKVFFNAPDASSDNETKLEECEQELFDAKSLVTSLSVERNDLRERLIKMEKKYLAAKNLSEQNATLIDGLQSKLAILKVETVLRQKLSEELEETRNKLDNYRSLDKLINGSQEEVNKAVEKYTFDEKTFKQVCMHLEFLKKSHDGIKKRYEQLKLRSQRESLMTRQSRAAPESVPTEVKEGKPTDTQNEDSTECVEFHAPNSTNLSSVLGDSFLKAGGKEVTFRKGRGGQKRKTSSRSEPFLSFSNPASKFYVYDGLGGSKKLSSVITTVSEENRMENLRLRALGLRSPRITGELPRGSAPAIYFPNTFQLPQSETDFIQLD